MSFVGSDARLEADLGVSIRKATAPVDTAPKRRHVRSCIIYTWDHHTSQAFWIALTMQPLSASDIQMFKALILVHKVLQEGHDCVLKDVQSHVNWLVSCEKQAQSYYSGYGKLIKTYAELLIAKVKFHRAHPSFNGVFEYDEYISLQTVNDPDQCYETISDLLSLQDRIHHFGKKIFDQFESGQANECKVSALVPLVVESYGIYKFLTSILRAFESVLDSEAAIEPLVEKYNKQHTRLVKFYFECSTLRYLTSLISVPKLPQDPPPLKVSDGEELPPTLPQRPAQTGSEFRAQNTLEEPKEIENFWAENEDTAAIEAEQRQLEAQQAAEMEQQRIAALQQQQMFEEQQRKQLIEHQMAQEALMREQLQQQAQGRVAELEREVLAFRGQAERSNLMLQQYDARVKSLETEVSQAQQMSQQQSESTEELITSLKEQLSLWKNKYESLAKLYTQLRQEHIDQLARMKQLQLKASSAQDAIDQKENITKDLKAKNAELANLIRERDKARYELDRQKLTQYEDVEKAKRELRQSYETDQASTLEELNRCKAELAHVQDQLEIRTRTLTDSLEGHENKIRELEDQIKEKDIELEVYQTGMDDTLVQLNELQLNAKSTNAAGDDMLDTILESSIESIEEAKYEFESSRNTGNINATPEYLLLCIEKCSNFANEFSTSFTDYFAEDKKQVTPEIFRGCSNLAKSIQDILKNSKGLSQNSTDEKLCDQLLATSKVSADRAASFFSSLLSSNLEKLNHDDKIDLVISNNVNLQETLQYLAKIGDNFMIAKQTRLDKGDGAESIVHDEFKKATESILQANEKLDKLEKFNESLSIEKRHLHGSIIDLARAITEAIKNLIHASSDAQQEVVARGRGELSPTQFYKQNSRWTEGLISAAKAVAISTALLIDTADNVINGKKTMEHLIVASNDVAASTAQLVASSRVKTVFGSKIQERLEEASRMVSSACKNLINQVQKLLRTDTNLNEKLDYDTMAPSEFKIREMEKQIEVLRLEQELSMARKSIGEMRKYSYRFEE